MIGQPIDKKVEGVGRFVAIVTLSVQPAESEEGRGSTAPKDDARDSERVLRVHARHKPHTRRLWQKTNRIKKRAATDHGDREGLRCCNRGNHIQSVTVKKKTASLNIRVQRFKQRDTKEETVQIPIRTQGGGGGGARLSGGS